MPKEQRNNMIANTAEEILISFIISSYHVSRKTATVTARVLMNEIINKKVPIYNAIYEVQDVMENNVGIARA